MYLIDYHTHSELSPDSTAPLIENAKAALAAGLSELCVTDHFDLLDFVGGRQHAGELDWATRMAHVHAAREAVGSALRLRLGIEFGSGQVDAADAARVLCQPELDFVIGSLHNLSLAEGGGDLYYINYDSSELCYRVLDDYFTSMAALVEADCYDVLGHIIYPLRYMCVRDGQKVDIRPYLERIRFILTGVAAHGRGIELNTWTGRTLEAWRPILEAYRACGGEFITVGSDAHMSGSIGSGIEEACALLRETGFRYVTTYDKRTPIQIKL